MEGLDNQKKVSTLNLSDNLIRRIDGISEMESLDSLYLARNTIGRGGLEDLEALLTRPSLTCIDL
jgi:Leucine-rich repeat (LRR) protein